MELKPGTPEYQAEYDKEMKRLEAEAGKDAKPSPDTNTSAADDKTDKTVEKKAETASTETVEELKARLEKAEKAIKDNQAWGTRNAQEVARLKKEAEESKRAATRPAILDANPGLEDAIKHVSQPAATANVEDAKAAWRDTVSRAIPDVEQLLGDQAFYAKASAKKAEFGPDWDDPITAIRELSSIRTEHLNQKSVQVAVEAARKDFETKAKKRSAMEVPGGSGGKDPAKEEDAAARYRTMSKEDFAKERSRVMGF